ncbi:NADH-ubiquinone oxidoreductase-F iron-sulfur binding region domain-containing protein [Sphingomonas echinoides]|uniref:NADH-ubiquinone oxidoreductase-F iron-sulfur binding region domain-containing protein n=1 Tax=Sphingomonas echinoides TaxID=59803 RepID=UPI0024133EBB|nr:NADH-ubiquinone oxidoreductase-F iron-sulfur binding region domain-containing protein [Sphingomonas echinoides]
MSQVSPIPKAYADPTIEPRLVMGDGPLSLEQERALGTYSAVDMTVLIDELEAAGLRGRGGAGFPAHVKWRTVAAASGPKVIVGNGEEGEPSSFKDRWLLVNRPHAVLDGLLIAADAVGAERIVLYVSHADAIASARRAVAELVAADCHARASTITIFEVAPTYVAGEESAACRAISGGPALPLAKPPRVFEAGVDGLPTLVANVETLAMAAWIARKGAIAYRKYGTDTSPGTALITLNGDCSKPGVFEVAYGTALSDAYARLAGGLDGPIVAILAGGWFGGVLPGSLIDIPMSFEDLRDQKSGFGCGSFTALTAASRPIKIVAEIAAWYARETAGQCGVCVKGTQAISGALAEVEAGTSTDATLTNLRRWGSSLGGRGACSFLDGAATLARTAVEALAESSMEVAR